jgi:hypothetical protein
MVMRINIILSFFVCGIITAAVDTTALPPSAQIEARGMIESNRGQILLRAGAHTYELRFGDRALRDYANDLRGEEVIVRGAFDAVVGGGRARLVIHPESVARAEEGMLMSATETDGSRRATPDVVTQPRRTDTPEIRIRVEPAPAPAQPAVAVRAPETVVTESAATPEFVDEPEVIPPQPTGRVQARNARALYKLQNRRWGTRTMLTPGGGAIILNNW